MSQQSRSRDAGRANSHVAAAAAFAVMCALGVGVAWEGEGKLHADNGPVVSARVPTTGAVTSYAPIVEQVIPAVVTIYTERHVNAVQAELSFSDQLLRQFFGGEGSDASQPGARLQGLGSGVVVRADGYILTNHHVVENAEQIRVELSDKRVLPGTVAGDDAPSDLAVVRIHATGLPTIALADSDHVRVGDVVLAIGNPLGVGETVTEGIISAKSRMTSPGEGGFQDFLQTDAPINQGNSGGALINLQGELIGINSQILSPSGGNIGLGFAIPSNMARFVMAQLMRDGRVHRAKIGVTAQPITADLAASLGLTEVRGALVDAVDPDGPAARAGLSQGDVILEVQDRKVFDGNDLRNVVANSAPGTTITLKTLHDGQPSVLSVPLEELSMKKPDAQATHDTSRKSQFGMEVQPVTPDVADALSLPRSTRGLLVIDVDPDGIAATSGLQPNDVIEKVNGQPTGSISEFQRAIDHLSGKPALVLIGRDGGNMFLALRSDES